MNAQEVDAKYKLLIGWDWGHYENAVHVRHADQNKTQCLILKTLPEIIHPWAAKMQAEYGPGEIAVGIERLDVAGVKILEQYDAFEIFQINPAALAAFRKSHAVANSKDDPKDARLLSQMLSTHLSTAKKHQLRDDDTRRIERLTILRRKKLADRQNDEKRLASILRISHPVILEVFKTGDLGKPVVLKMLKKWPRLNGLLSARPETIRKFLYAHNLRSKTRVEHIVATISKAQTVLEDEVELDLLEIEMVDLIESIEKYDKQFKRLEGRIKVIWQEYPERNFYQALPGAGPALAPRLAVIWGMDRNRWSSATEILNAKGVSPVRRASGKSALTCFRLAAPKFERQTLHEFARCSIGQSAWAKAFYEMKKQSGKTHNQAVRALAYKWGRVIFACWKKNIEYDEATYLTSLIKSGSPIIGFMNLAKTS